MLKTDGGSLGSTDVVLLLLVVILGDLGDSKDGGDVVHPLDVFLLLLLLRWNVISSKERGSQQKASQQKACRLFFFLL